MFKKLGALAVLSISVLGGSVPAHATFQNYVYDSSTNEMDATYVGDDIAGPTDFATNMTPSHPTVAKLAIAVIYSGPYWNTTAGAAAKTQSETTVAKLIVTPYFTGLRQYGLTNVTKLAGVVDATQPPNPVTSTYLNTVFSRSVSRFSVPSGYQALYVFVPPPGVSIPGAAGAHGQFTSGGKSYLSAWVGSIGTNPTTLSHELAEVVSDPGPVANWLLERDFGTSTDFGREIADACESEFDSVNGLSVSAYWSQNVRACVIPEGTPSAVAGNALTATFDGDTTFLYFLGPDQHIYQRVTISGTTYMTDISIQAAAVPALGATPLASYWLGDEQGWVFFIGSDSHLHALYNDDGWADSDITVAAGLTSSLMPETSFPSVHGLSAFYNPADNSHHVFYIDGGGSLRECVGRGGAGWSSNALTGSLGTANAPNTGFVTANAQGTQLFATYDGTQHVYYFDTNNHIREAQGNGSWSIVDWTALFQTAPAASSRDGVVGMNDHIVPVSHVFYIDTSSHVRELWWYAGSYGTLDLTSASGDTTLVGGSSITAYMDSSTRIHIDFIGQDSKIHELVRTFYQTFTDPITGAAIYNEQWSGGVIQQSGSTIGSRLLTSAYDTVLGTAHVFGLVPTGFGSNAYVMDLSSPGSGWTQTTSSFTDPPAFP